ncbi:MAG: RNA polymerase factor sigma-32 [Holosporales bacterium]|jgi:RNA polymerase sigma-32 factor|nr:RNA polymerase factor sigma-32 [Holosporales bacterium]
MPQHEMQVGLTDESHIAKYLHQINQFPILDKDEEFTLINQWLNDGNKDSLGKLVKSHMRLVAKIAKGYRGYGLPLDELIAEGHVGIMQALKHFQPSKGFRFATYAIHWIKAALLNYVFKASSAFKIKANAEHRKVFFKLKSLKNTLGLNMQDQLTPENVTQLAQTLKVNEEVIKTIEESSKNSTVSIYSKKNEDDDELIDWVNIDDNNLELSVIEKDELDYRKNLLTDSLKILNKTEYEVLVKRRFSDNPPKLEDLAAQMSFSRERVRQIEHQAFDKIKKYMLKLSKMNRKAPTNVSVEELQRIGVLLMLPKSLSEFLARF